MTQCHESQYPHQFSILELFVLPLQKLRQEFRELLGEAAMSPMEEELRESMSTEPCATSPPRVLKSRQQHVADYIHLMMEEGEDPTMGEDRLLP